jgi:L-iditol 2-dehydrogenase
MQAIVKYQEGDGYLALREVAEPNAGTGQVKISVQAAGICGSDLHIWHGDIAIPVAPPVILGHEFAGIVTEVGEGVSGIEVGHRVTAENSHTVCEQCEYCMTGDYNLCAERRATGYAFDGAFAPYCVVPAERVHHLPDTVDFHTGALSDPIACAYRAVCEKAQVTPGETVLILGVGPMGLFSTQFARLSGARVILAGTSADGARLELGLSLGADLVVDVTQPASLADITTFAGSPGIDVVLECSGAPAATRLGLQLIKKRGRFILVGIHGRPLELDWDQILYKELVVKGMFSHKYPAWERAIALAARRLIRARPLITDVLPLSRWEDGFQRFADKKAIKVIFEPHAKSAGMPNA